MTKTLALIAATLLLSLQLSACNTLEGVGKDVSKAGDALEEAAKKAKK